MKYNNQLPLPNGMTFLEACNFSVKLLYTHGFISKKDRENIWQRIENNYWEESKKAGLDHISQVGKKVDGMVAAKPDETKENKT